MSYKSKIIFNAIFSSSQILIVGLVYLVLYKFLLNEIGIKMLGIWSLIVATTSLGSLANFGITSGIIKFVSTYNSRKDFVSLNNLLFTSFFFITIMYIMISLIIFLFAKSILSYLIDPLYLKIALDILPYSLLCLVINASSGIFASALEGIQKNHIKSNIYSVSSLLLLGTSILLTPLYGINGLVYAQLLQAIIVLISCIFFLKISLKKLHFFTWNWNMAIFKEVFNYGIKFQGISIILLTIEPITKVLLSKFGGLTLVGYYEMASKLVGYLKGLLVSANQVIIPVIAEAKESSESSVINIYKKSLPIIFFLGTLLIISIILFIPLISKIWIGRIEHLFIFSALFCALSAFFNIISLPAYFSYLGEGNLTWLIISYGVIGGGNILFSILIGYSFNGYGSIIANTIAVSIGSLMTLYSFNFVNKVSFFSLIKISDIFITFLAISLSYCFVIWYDFNNFNILNYLYFIAVILTLILVILSFKLFGSLYGILYVEIKQLLNFNKKSNKTTSISP